MDPSVIIYLKIPNMYRDIQEIKVMSFIDPFDFTCIIAFIILSTFLM